MKTSLLAILAATGLCAASIPALAADTVDAIKERGKVACGVNGSRAGFSSIDSQGRWVGLDVDTCRAIAAAVLGDAEAAEFVKTTSQTRFTALQTGEIDVLTRNTTQTYSRDAELGVDFAAITFYDGQGFMVAKALGVDAVEQLDGASICVLPGTTAEQVVETVFAERGLAYTPIVFQDANELSAAFFGGRCDAFIQSTSGLASARATLAPNAADYTILSKVFDKDPHGPRGAPGRRALEGCRDLDGQRDDHRRRARTDLRERRPNARDRERHRQGSPRRRRTAPLASRWGCRTIGSIRSSNRSGTMERCSSAILAPVPRWAWSARRTPCGPMAASSTRPR